MGKDTAKVGYFKTQLKNGVAIELSASRHAGIMDYSFPEGEKHVLVDVSHYLPGSPGDPNGQYFTGGEIQIEEDGKAYSGYGTYIGGFNNGQSLANPEKPNLIEITGAPFTVYFWGEFSEKPDEAQAFSGANTSPMPRYHNHDNGGTAQATFGKSQKLTSGLMNDRIGLLMSWKDGAASHIVSRVGISSISAAKARSYIQKEIPSWKLNDTVTDAVKEWNEDVFNKVQVALDASANMTHVSLLYSSLYFIHMMPSDRTGENPLWDSGEPYWDDFYTMCRFYQRKPGGTLTDLGCRGHFPLHG